MNETQTCEQRPASASSAAGSIKEVLDDFDRHLEGQRGCTKGTRQHYRREARALLVRVKAAHRLRIEKIRQAGRQQNSWIVSFG